MEEEELEECNTSLNLGIGLGKYVATKNNAKQKKNNKRRAGVCMDFSLSPQLVHHHQPKEEVINIDDDDDGLIKNMHQLVWGSKRKIEEEEQDDKKSSSSNNNNIDEYYYSNDIRNNISKEKEKNCGRKKLRLNKEQSTLLEESFKQHTTLNAVIFLSFNFIFFYNFFFHFFVTFYDLNWIIDFLRPLLFTCCLIFVPKVFFSTFLVFKISVELHFHSELVGISIFMMEYPELD